MTDVLLLDEPTVGVDPQSRVRLLDLVHEQVGAGTCVLYATHHMEEAQELCDRHLISRVPLALIWCTYAETALLFLLLFFQLVASTRRGANLVSTLVLFSLMMIGGSLFPFETMPAGMREVGRWTPNGLALVHLKDMLFATPRPLPLLLAAVAIGAPAIVLFFAPLRRVRGRFAVS